MKKRTFIKLAGTVGAGMLVAPFVGCGNGGDSRAKTAAPRPFGFDQEPLGYDVAALAPKIDAVTMEIHYGKHHAGYVRKLNNALRAAEGAYDGQGLIELLAGLAPDQTALRNNGGGHYNHTLYWRVLTPGGAPAPEGLLKEELEATFGSVEAFAEQFAAAGASQFGSGWAWLIRNAEGQLEVTSTANQDNPLMANIVDRPGTPLLGMDVWEHAYYLNYQNRRKDYIQGFLSLVNWDEVALNAQG
jgi:Fe-Mn family superoxide dismutase